MEKDGQEDFNKSRKQDTGHSQSETVILHFLHSDFNFLHGDFKCLHSDLGKITKKPTNQNRGFLMVILS